MCRTSCGHHKFPSSVCACTRARVHLALAALRSHSLFSTYCCTHARPSPIPHAQLPHWLMLTVANTNSTGSAATYGKHGPKECLHACIEACHASQHASSEGRTTTPAVACTAELLPQEEHLVQFLLKGLAPSSRQVPPAVQGADPVSWSKKGQWRLDVYRANVC